MVSDIHGHSDGECTPQTVFRNRPSPTDSSNIINSAGRKKRDKVKKKAKLDFLPLDTGRREVQQKRCHTQDDKRNSKQQRLLPQTQWSVNDGERVKRVDAYAGAGNVCANWQRIYGESKFEYKTKVCNERWSIVALNSSKLTHNRSEASHKSKFSTSCDGILNKCNSHAACDFLQIGCSLSQHIHIVHVRAENGTNCAYTEKGTTACIVVNNDKALQGCDISTGKFADKKISSFKTIIFCSKVKAYASRHPCSTDSKAYINPVGIKLSVDWLSVIDFVLITIPYTAKHQPACCLEWPQQESQFGCESHLNGGVMVHGHTLVSNVSSVLVGSLRGDKASRSHGFGSLRNKSGFEQFHDTHNEATFAMLSENRQANYARSSYRAEIVGASKLTGVYSESDAAHKPLEDKLLPHGMNDGPANDHKSTPGTSN